MTGPGCEEVNGKLKVRCEKMEAGKMVTQKRAQGTWRRAKGRKGKN